MFMYTYNFICKHKLYIYPIIYLYVSIHIYTCMNTYINICIFIQTYANIYLK